MDIFGNKIKSENTNNKQINKLNSILDSKIKNVINEFEKELIKIFEVTKKYISFKGKRLVNINDPINDYDAVTKQYLEKLLQNHVTKPEYTSILTQFSNYYNKKEIEKTFSEYFTKMDLQPYITQINKICDKQSIEFTFLTGKEVIEHQFEYDVKIKKIIISGANIDGEVYPVNFSVKIKRSNGKIQNVYTNQLDNVHEMKWRDKLLISINQTIKTVPVYVKIFLFGELLLEEENLEL